jgi:TonB family protein
MAGFVWADTQLRSQALFHWSRSGRGKSTLPSGRQIPRFTEVGTTRTRWDFFGASALMQLIVVTVLFWIPILLVRTVPPALAYNVIPVFTSPISEYKPPPPPPPKKFLEAIRPKTPVVMAKPEKPPLVFDSRVVAKAATPALKAQPEAPVVTGAFANKMEVKLNAPVVRRPVQVGNLESTGSSAVPTLTNRPLNEVQTGGFGDPNGVPAKGNNTRAANINAVGSFELPSGPGYGNGTGGSKGARGTVASAGFGSGIAIAAPEQPAVRRSVQSTGFGDAAPAANSESKQRTASTGVSRTPIEILAKPNPVYTEEARKLRIEGNVKLSVIFLASGELQIVGVTQSLGHGLDEAAVAVAKRIRFRPATEAGRAVDQPAVVTIEFKLAY